MNEVCLNMHKIGFILSSIACRIVHVCILPKGVF